jgi:RNA polymerase sigma factor (sigma-70 family)
MANGQFGSVLRHIRQLIGPRSSESLTDGQLLERFVKTQDESAFETLLQRHGPMVLGLCRSILHDAHDADDAFQATFLVLARKASSIRKSPSVASWLYGVAHRTALRAKINSAKRRVKERQAGDMSHSDDVGELGRQELRSVVHEELQRLPEKYRAPLVLCYLEGKTNESAASELGWPAGSMAKRLSRGRDLLRERLAYRGVALPAGMLAVVLGESAATASVPPLLLEATLKSAVLYAGKASALGMMTSTAATLADGVVQAMSWSRLQIAALLLLAVGLIGSGAGLLAFSSLGDNANAANDPNAPVAVSADPQTPIVVLDFVDPLAATKRTEAFLTVRADRTVVLGGDDETRRVEGKLTDVELQALLRFAIHDQQFFAADANAIREAIRAEEARKGPAVRAGGATLLRIQANGKQHEVRFEALTAQARKFPEIQQLKQLAAVQTRLEKLAVWLHAGGQPGVDGAVKSANEQLKKQFPESPALTATDLQTAKQQADGTTLLTFERRGVVEKEPFSFVYASVRQPASGDPKVTVRANLVAAAGNAKPPSGEKERMYLDPINLTVPDISTDPTVKFDYDIVYVRTPRKGDNARSAWTEIAHPALMDANGDLMLRHPDGSEEVLVKGGEDGSVTDPMVSFDGEWVYFSHLKGLKGTSQHGQTPFGGADIYKIHVKSRKLVRLTNQEWTPNLGAANWASDFRTPEKGKNYLNYGVLNMGPCPLPGGKVVFTSNRNAFRAPKHPTPCLQLFVMDEDGGNVEQIGYLNIGMALHPVVLKDGRIMFSSLESQGVRNNILWGLWVINPDGTNWGPMISAFDPISAPNAFHFQTQLSDGSVIAEEYYNQNNSGFGSYLKLPPAPPEGTPGFGPGFMGDPRNPPLRFGRHDNGRARNYRMPFTPFGAESFTPFAMNNEGPADRSVRGDKTSPAVGKFTHPSGAPDNHLLTCYSPGPANHQYSYPPEIDGGLYLIKSGKPIDEPAQMLLIKNDPNFNEQWPRAVVSYKRIYGIDEPKKLPTVQNDGKQSPHLPEGTPFGLIGTSSFYKRESYPNGVVPPGSVTATWNGKNERDGYRGLDPFNTSENGPTLNWFNQGADAGLYGNDEIHAVRILAMEPTTDRNRGNYPRDGKLFRSFAMERLRVIGEIPLRKLDKDGKQPIDPDGNPDTSFLARIPADVAFTFQTLDKDGMVLNMAQTWHQLRPGEIRHDCGGCHAHSQKPTEFKLTAAAQKDYSIFDLTQKTPLLTAKSADQSGKKWDAKDETGLRYVEGVQNVEFFRDIKPILDRSCVACHTKSSEQPAGNLVLDDDGPHAVSQSRPLSGTYFRLALDEKAKYGHKPIIPNLEWRNQQATRYIRMFQSRRSLLTWKVYGKRTDGWTNDDFPTETVPGDVNTLQHRGQPVPNTHQNRNAADLDYNGVQMPPPEAVAGTYVGPKGEKIKVPALTDEEKRTIVRWIDLGCPIDLDYDAAKPLVRGQGWMVDDNRPTLAVPYPQAGVNGPLSKLVVGMHDYYTGLAPESFTVTADFAIDGTPAGENLAKRFKAKGDGIWELVLNEPLAGLARGKLTVSVKDKEGNLTKVERLFSVVGAAK